ncbi:hypothetical protein ACLIMP_18790 [Novosphingobium aerophilum]|uniref:hypothetical protein n=1 Tax=Novosphingobium TaxID=165696 RepID=UPI0012C26268|nr:MULTISPECIES: hypothetical protein [unclassified Novosphingobium]MPS68113.1 hypothetical protein [Novosphingobium sp.]WRT95313.1 hypothetical protein U9J33_24365 [Novosphingobium sp. RL4]
MIPSALERRGTPGNGAFPAKPRFECEFGPDLASKRHALAHSLLELADQNLAQARLMKSVALDLMYHGAAGEARRLGSLEVDEIRQRLDLRYRGSAMLLIELLATPGCPRGDHELASIVCLRKHSVSALRVFVHDLRTALARAGYRDVIKCKMRRGYFLTPDHAPQVLALVG